MAYRPVLAPLSRDCRKDLRAELARGSYVVKGVCQETVECGPALRNIRGRKGNSTFRGPRSAPRPPSSLFNATTVDFVGFISFQSASAPFALEPAPSGRKQSPWPPSL
jgi:hypothetical protein